METKVIKIIFLLSFVPSWAFADSKLCGPKVEHCPKVAHCKCTSNKNTLEFNCSNDRFEIFLTIVNKHSVKVKCNYRFHLNYEWIPLVPVLNKSFYDRTISLKIDTRCKLPERFSEITPKFPPIDTFDISFKPIKHLTKHFFDVPTSIVFLNLKNDNLKELAEDIFINLEYLEKIILSNNFFKIIPSRIFSNNHKLSHFKLNRNNAKKNLKLVLEDEIFMNKSELITVSLTRNDIEVIPKKTFRDCAKLALIFLQENKLSQLDRYSLGS